MSLLRCVVICLAVLTPSATSFGQSSASYRIERSSIDAGAARANSASYTLVGTVGQPDAGLPQAGASQLLRGGFHVASATTLPDELFRDSFE
jgi:hypothetical protein